MSKRYWLMKSEPDVYSITDLASEKNHPQHWGKLRGNNETNIKCFSPTSHDDCNAKNMFLSENLSPRYLGK